MRRCGGRLEESGEVLNRLEEGIALYDHDDVNGIEVLLATKATAQVGPRVDGGVEFAAHGAEESQEVLNVFGRNVKYIPKKDTHGNVVPQSSEVLGFEPLLHDSPPLLRQLEFRHCLVHKLA